MILDADLDMKDWQLESVGNAAANPFMGKFDGAGHLIQNLNMKDEALFGYMDGRAGYGASLANLRIESTHPTALLNTGVNPIYIAGISILAPSTGNSIATNLGQSTGVAGTSYVVGCIHVGDAGGALVGTAGNVNMFGCMQAARGITGGALIGTDANANPIFKPQISLAVQKSTKNTSAIPAFRTFMCNFYDTELASRQCRGQHARRLFPAGVHPRPQHRHPARQERFPYARCADVLADKLGRLEALLRSGPLARHELRHLLVQRKPWLQASLHHAL